MKTNTILNTALGLGVLFATVWVIGKAWKKSQNFSGASGQEGCPCYEHGRHTGYSSRCCTQKSR